MDDLLKTYATDIDLLLTEVCMTGALHGLDAQVSAIADHLQDLPRTQGAALLARALAKTAVRDYPKAIEFAARVLSDPQLAALHGEAEAFRTLALQLQAGQPVEPLSPLA